jgi:hypothetical protein
LSSSRELTVAGLGYQAISESAAMPPSLPERRDLILAALPLLFAASAGAEALNPAQTMITLPGKIRWKTRPGWPKESVANADLAGSITSPGLYYELIKWYPGYMSAPHSYITDRLCVVVSGIWWVNSGADFDPANCQPVGPGSFVRRVAHTPHYDGVVPDGKEPAVIAICGIGPAGMTYLDPSKPGWRKL